ncbi:MAG: 2-oxoacid:acceptor oxidoreductase family protein [Candidatus Asgardarchaeia archaeon]
MTHIEFIFGGIGGQGIITMAVLLGHAAVIYDNLNAVQTQSYGPEARGSASRAEVIIKEGRIDYPKVQQADVFVCMSQEAYEKYISMLKKDGVLIIDSDLVHPENPPTKKIYKIPATKLAEEEIGNRIVANIIMLGAVIAIIDTVTLEAVKKTIAERFPKYITLNYQAFDLGYKYGKSLIKGQ